MTPEDLRADIPALEECTYLNTGASGPSPRRVVDAVCGFQRYHEFEAPAGEGMYAAGWGAFDDARAAAADFLGARTDEIALTQSTADGILLVADSIDWQPGDKVVRTDLEHPAGTLPWRRLEDTHGIEVEVVECADGRLDLDAFAEAVRDARLACLSSCSWNYGTRLAVEAATEIAHDAGAMVLVDAVQSIGQMPVDVREWNVDFLAGSTHKWPLGPWGTGVLYLDDDARRGLRPTRIGGHGVESASDEDYEYRDSARMFDLTTVPTAVYRGQEAALEMVDDLGMDTIQGHIERLTDRLKDGIPDGRLLSPREYESGLVSFDVADPEGFVERLADDGIVIRSIPDPEAVRASVHAFNSEGDVDALLEYV